MLLSYIIPCHNLEKYISKLLESLLNQTNATNNIRMEGQTNAL